MSRVDLDAVMQRSDAALNYDRDSDLTSVDVEARWWQSAKDVPGLMSELLSSRQFVNAARAFIRAVELDSSYAPAAWALLADALAAYDKEVAR